MTQIDGDALEKLTQLAIGVLCVGALIYFGYLEVVGGGDPLSDRMFYLLVALAITSLGLRELQYLIGRRPPPGGEDEDEGGGGGGSGGR